MPTSSGGSSSSSGGALALLSTTTAVGGDNFDVAGISGAYNDLVVVAIIRGALSGAADTPTMICNNDSGANYDFEHIQANSTTLASAGGLAQTSIQFAYAIPAATGTASRFLHLVAEIPGYASTSWHKQYIANYGGTLLGTTTYYRAVTSGLWRSTAAITRLTIATASGFVAGSQVRIYGRL